jgi:hypothetical protein
MMGMTRHPPPHPAFEKGEISSDGQGKRCECKSSQEGGEEDRRPLRMESRGARPDLP